MVRYELGRFSATFLFGLNLHIGTVTNVYSFTPELSQLMLFSLVVLVAFYVWEGITKNDGPKHS